MADTTFKSPAERRDDILRTIRNGLILRGVEDPNVTPGSDFHNTASGLANELAVLDANIDAKSDELMPDTATGEGLDRWLAIYGLSRRAAAGAFGNIVLEASAACALAVGTQLIDAGGLRFEIQVGGTYSNGDVIPVTGVDTGAATNHLAGEVLRWVSPPAYASSSVVIDTGGLSGGAEAEDDDTARERLFDKLRNPPASGNWSHLTKLAEDSSTKVQKAFSYPAVNGPSTYAVAAVAYATTTSKSRVIDSTTVANIITPYVLGEMPEHAQGYITTVVDVPADVSILLSLPEAPSASPPGIGGGWTDGTPWPKVDGTTTRATVSSVATNKKSFTVTAVTGVPPVAGLTKICFLNYTTWTLYTATVTSTSGTGPYVVEIDTPFVGLASGDYVFPHALNIKTYVDTVLLAFAQIGPGEKVGAGTYGYARGFRHPVPQQAWPYSLGAQQLKMLTDAGEEVLNAQWNYRSDGTTTLDGSGGFGSVLTPAYTTATTAPNILVPRRVGLYRNYLT